MTGQRSLLLSLVFTLFLSIASVWAKNVTLAADDPLLVYSNQTTPYLGGWQFNTTGVICDNEGGIAYAYALGEWVSFQFNGTAVFVVLAECYEAGLSSITIDGVQANVTAQDSYYYMTSIGCPTRTLYATNLTNTNHTVNVTHADNGVGRTVINKFIFDDGAETPIADPTATRAPVTISDTGATPTSTYSSSSSSSDSGGFDCGTGCKASSAGGIVGLIFAALFWYWFWRCCCCGGSRKTVKETVYVERPASPKPQAVVVVAAVEVQQTNVHVTAVDRNSAVIASPPAYTPPAREQTNFR
ncbi:hypothetical protein FS837_001097 [Tulasnella sp. UAMH 9824]|nr:hypothetical protein FS837_001097 [Tulasnella sp. UAMH 9824]